MFEALERVLASFPFPIAGIDSDNGSEFINEHLLRWCEQNKITFTRSRSGNKNDGAHVEQKNWARVRELVGYYRYDTGAELAKKHDTATTPHQRAIAHEAVPKRPTRSALTTW